MKTKNLLLIVSFVLFIFSCKSENKDIPKSDNIDQTDVSNISENNQSIKPTINQQKTKILFESLTSKKLSELKIDISLEPTGILIHPGLETTEAVFNIAGKFQTINLVSFIKELPTEVLSNSEAGIVGIEIMVDGQSKGRRVINPLVNQSELLNLANSKELKIIVDCANKEPGFDWLNIGVE